MKLPVLDAAGQPVDIGRLHGATYAEQIGRFAAERVERAGQALWVGADRSRADVIALAEDCLAAHEAYSPRLTAELRAMADAAELSPAEMLIVSGFTDFVDTACAAFSGSGAAPGDVDNCTAMIVPAARSATGTPLFAQTWDMHETATEHVFVLRGVPDDGPAFTTFTSRGCLGMIGMNEAGITIGINNLTGNDGRIGVTWNFVVREVLAQTDFAAAEARLAEADLAGAHNYLLVGPDGQGMNVEAMSTQRATTRLDNDVIVHTNHCLAKETRAVERPRLPEAQAHSEKRLARAEAMLACDEAIDVERLATVTRDTQAICYPPTPITKMTTCGAVIADPAARRLWALRGLPSEQSYVAFDVAGAAVASE
ncbi:C45 family autoproteolytic acyltransferase/hydolase [Salinisphaera hydrothermalis]|uniref:Peptidase C45 acyl-coenzyme A:6-aminopenicillanic acid acyl-transferase n=1 Tax=Salinisphaera hydrothermalis (strain C41B8) TaxID=1304275 RepID=A0A084IGB6_SALHC|nr:C45 family peptidase [Salinisphaera hydrothermalis]KEZ75750.1 peptidase C45 acyl-coenzyme A:6-aminopenicillanic acid acyl-transferase [Salinisphaera hydrothermalis C41B8]